MRKMILGFIFLCSCAASGYCAVKGEPVDYKVNGVTYKGYLAYDDQIKTKRPGVLVVPEWWGVNAYAHKRARMLAELGYTALAVDMYGEGKLADNPKDAGALSQAVYADPAAAKARFLAAMGLLQKFPLTDSKHIGAIGYCFGGAIVLNMAMAGVPLDAVVSFHASLPTPPEGLNAKDVKAKILICHGGADKFTPDDKIMAFKGALEKADVEYQFNVYEGATHSFTNPDADMVGKKFDLPIAYNAQADQLSWGSMQELFKKVFGS